MYCLTRAWLGDHAKYVTEYEKAGIPVFKPYTGMKDMNLNGGAGFKIRAFDLVHDVPCYGFYITEPTMGSLIYASDTEYIRWRFKEVNHILVEANYSQELLDRDSAKFAHQVTGHMSIDTACEFLKVNKSSHLRNVILCHLSGDCSDSEEFINKAKKVVDCPVCVAHKGLEVDLNLLPF